MKSGKTMVGMSAARALANFAEEVGRTQWGKVLQPWFCLICRAKAKCGEEAFLLKAFLVTFVATKVTRPQRP